MMCMFGPARFCSLFFLCTAFASAALSQKLEGAANQLPAEFIQMLQTQVSWDQGLGRSGQHLRFALIEGPPNGERLNRFRIYAEGAREGVPYILGVWKIGTYPKDLQILSNQVYVNRKGLLMTRKPRNEEENADTVDGVAEYDIGIQAADGEPIRLILRSKDSSLMAPGTLVPFPIASSNKNCRLEARRSVPEDQAILMYVDGFAPNSTLEVEGDSAGEKKVGQHSVDDKGHGQFVELPFVTGRDRGILHESIATKECSVSIDIPWGKGSYLKH